jgi:hypothetical protein
VAGQCRASKVRRRASRRARDGLLSWCVLPIEFVRPPSAQFKLGADQ